MYAVPRFVDMLLEGGDWGSWVVDVGGDGGGGLGDEAVEAVWWAIVVRGYYCCEEVSLFFVRDCFDCMVWRQVADGISSARLVRLGGCWGRRSRLRFRWVCGVRFGGWGL